MIPAPFEYAAPASLDEALRLLGATPGAKVLGGGMSLIPALKHRLAAAPLLVDLARVEGLGALDERRGTLRVGARVTHGELLRAAPAELPAVAETARVIGDVQVRNRGTLAGSLVHADPAADWPALFLALGGEASVVGPRGRRQVAAEDFFVSMLTSAVGAGEVLVEVALPFERKRAGAAYRKLRQQASGFAVVGVAAQVVLDRKGRIDHAALGVTGVNAVPFRARGVEERLRGATPEAEALRAACNEVEEADPLDDLHASAEYRRHLARVYAARAVAAACQRAAAS